MGVIQGDNSIRKGEVSMNPTGRKPVDDEERVEPVTILDGLGRVLRIVPAEEFRRIHGVSGRPDTWRGRRERARTRHAAETPTEPD
jgi:hypothetical protein